MTEPIHKGKDLPPVWVIHAASGGDSEAMEIGRASCRERV